MKSSRTRRLLRALKRRQTRAKKYQDRKKGVFSSLYGQIALWILGVGLLVMLFLGTIGVYQTWSEVREEADIAEEEYAEAKQRYEQASTSLQQVKTSEGVEQQLRERFNVAKEGEGVVVILDSSEDAEALAGENQQGSWWKQIIFFWR